MTFRTESRITIARDITEVWGYVCDVGRWSEWAPTVLECWVRGGGPLQPGARVQQRAKGILGSSRGRSQEVTAVDAPRYVAFAGPMGTSEARWAMELEPIDDGRTEALMWIEVDLAGVMRAIPARALKARVQRVSDHEMAAIKAAVEFAVDRTRERLIQTYRKKAKHYDITSRFYPAPGYPQRSQRLKAVQALGLHPGDTVIDIACGTGLNFSLIEQAIGPEGRIIGVDLTDAMLTQARARIHTNDWSNITLVQADAADFQFPSEIDAILSTYALSQVPECAQVIAHGAAALAPAGRWVVLDLKLPDLTPRWLTRLGIATAGRSNSLDEWITRRPWQTIRAAIHKDLTNPSWTELCLGTAYLATGSRALEPAVNALPSPAILSADPA